MILNETKAMIKIGLTAVTADNLGLKFSNKMNWKNILSFHIDILLIG